jgi:multidrug efflux pump
VTLFAMLAIAAAGIWAYATIGRAEDPPFTVKQMLVMLSWPGASADDMQRAVTDRVERTLQDVPMLDYTTSYSKPGEATILVVLKDSTPPREVPGLWYEVRKKVNDMRGTLPQGVAPPAFNDEFGDVFGIVYAFTGDGFTLPQLRHIAEDVRQGLLAIPGVGKIDLIGEQQERIHVDFSYHKLPRFGLSAQDMFAAIRRENSVVGGGSIDTRQQRIFVRTGTGLDGVATLNALPIQARGHLIPLGDIATVSRGTEDPPRATIR